MNRFAPYEAHAKFCSTCRISWKQDDPVDPTTHCLKGVRIISKCEREGRLVRAFYRLVAYMIMDIVVVWGWAIALRSVPNWARIPVHFTGIIVLLSFMIASLGSIRTMIKNVDD